MQKNNPTITNAWCMYDWANSVYSLVITSTIFPVYYGAVTTQADGSNNVNFWGLEVNASALFSFAISASFLLAALASPFLTAIADYSGRKKAFMQFFCYLGSVSCALLYFFTADTLNWSVLAFVLATVGYSGSIVFYNSYLPDIATEDRYDALSARGFSLGYIGSVILLVLNILPILKPEWFGNISSGMASRISFLCTGVWWFVFAQYTFYHLPHKSREARSGDKSWLLNGFRELKKVWGEVSGLPLLKRFLLAFFFYNMGVQTVMYVATIFGDKELKLPAGSLIGTILILQLVAIAGASGFSWLSGRYGNARALIVGVVIWIGICIGAYFVHTENEFYLLAALVGLVMGGIQALSRSTYSKLLPADTHDTASYFSFYDIVEKGSIVLGTLSYGLIAQVTGSMRNSIIALTVFFVLGLIFLLKIPKRFRAAQS
ncbi:MFS transporter, UMF1 family [Flexibacter flexilis DSM 6793]|uniref:MFS transporter, UMF1 family n=1 Tax=Flexibacter flexilis DSM 6793 TaxID=927664 RepID=A0A1I1DKQ3_9BACT|nr:MFS transporter [Flexibacter flexilis]SFB73668.1 MFS transporter, UMF1 family [Flexibacter flexilis DSM 6793]